MSENLSLTTHASPTELITVAAIGASAGGLEAISELLEHLPGNLGMAYIIIQHLDPDHESILPELLEKKTAMPVHKVENNMPVEANHVYVIPPGTFMSIVDSSLKLVTRKKSEGVYHSIDYFLTDFAPIYTNNAIGIILSGTATDGTLGLKTIKAAGGITFAQDKTAKYQGMPGHAIESGYVDFVLSPEKIAHELIEISKNPLRLAPPDRIPENKDEIKRILVILHAKLGVDFSGYKTSTIYRRIMRRVVLNRCKDLKEYLQFIRKNEEEAHLLYKDLLINVTSFFRDPSIYLALVKTILPRITKGRKLSDPVRIWIPGCATGEEAYSIAICLLEFFNDKSIDFPIQIFATDLNAAAIERARAGIYLKGDLTDIPTQRLEGFFTPINGHYQVAKSIRDICIFARHNLLKDPPFSRLDLISCHNVLIYLETEAQRKILQNFHYGLNADGYLLLGKSETAGNEDALFKLVDKENKIYSKKSVTGIINFDFSMHTPHQKKATPENIPLQEMEKRLDVEKEMDKVLLSEFVPPGILINRDLNIIEFRGNTSSFLRPASGKASFHLLKMIREELVFELRTIINKSMTEGRRIKKEGIIYKHEGLIREVGIEVIPMKASVSETFYLVIFKEAFNTVTPEKVRSVKGKKQENKDHQIAALEQQLKDAREQIKTMSEEFESFREELQSSNEEVLSSNEELQSMNEELETSQEELQSTNEELTTINDELQLRNTELKEAIAYAEAIIYTIREPLIVLNQDLRVNTANQAYYKLFQGSPKDIEGRMFYEIQGGLWDIPALRNKLSEINKSNRVLNDFKIEKEFPFIGKKTVMINANEMALEGKRTKILIAIENITERAELEQQKDDFISIASHELKTPVVALKLYAQIIHQSFKERGDTESEELAERMKEQVTKLILLIENLLDMTRITKGILELKETFFDLNQLITEVVNLIQTTAPNHQLIMKLEPEIEIWGDRNRIEQVLINLISNAVKYSPDADKVIINANVNKGTMEVSIQDFGIGIPEDMQQSLFQRFSRTDTTKNTFPGMGLGLYISSEIIKRHKGKIWVNSVFEKGSNFYFSLPMKKKNNNQRN